jgi:dihydroorotate dehydrogenase
MILDLAARLARQIDPETAHGITIKALESGLLPFTSTAIPKALEVRLPRSGLVLPGPIGLAAGFDKNAQAFAAMSKLGFGFIECGTVTPRPQPGNPRPRLFRLREDKAVINRMGFNNEGLEPFASRLRKRALLNCPIGANIGANKDSTDRIADYVTGIQALAPLADYVTLNISSPNTPGLRGLQDKAALEDLLGRCGQAALANGAKPVFLKVAPDLDDLAIRDIAAAALAAPHLHGLIVSNTTLERPQSLQSMHKGEAGGLSGAPLMSRSTHVLAAFASDVTDRLDLIGVGGISTAGDIWAKLQAGAQAVQLYSALVFEGPGLIARLNQDLLARVKAQGVTSLAEALAGSGG